MLCSMISFYLALDFYEKLLWFRFKYLIELDCEIRNILVLIRDAVRENIDRNDETREKVVKLVTKEFIRMCVKKESPSTKLISSYLETICLFSENEFHAIHFFDCFIDSCSRYHISGKEARMSIARQNIRRNGAKLLPVIGKTFAFVTTLRQPETFESMSIIIGNSSTNMLRVVLSALDVATNLTNINRLICYWKEYPFAVGASGNQFINNWRNSPLDTETFNEVQGKISHLCSHFDNHIEIYSEWAQICLFLCQCSANTKFKLALTEKQWDSVKTSVEGNMLHCYSM